MSFFRYFLLAREHQSTILVLPPTPNPLYPSARCVLEVWASFIIVPGHDTLTQAGESLRMNIPAGFSEIVRRF